MSAIFKTKAFVFTRCHKYVCHTLNQKINPNFSTTMFDGTLSGNELKQQVILSYSANGFDTAVDIYNGIINNYELAALNVCNDERVPEDVKQRVWIMLRLSTAMKDTLGMFLETGGAKG